MSPTLSSMRIWKRLQIKDVLFVLRSQLIFRNATLDPNHLWLATFQTKYMAGQILTWLRQAGLFDVWEMELF